MRRILEQVRRSLSVFAQDFEPLISLVMARFIVWRVMRREAHR